MNLAQLKRLFLKTLIACLVAVGGLAVVTVLVGSFNELFFKALFTILFVALHSLFSLAFIQNNEKQDTFDTLTVFSNATFGIIVLSFATSILGVWQVLPGELVARLYSFYGVLLFAILHGEVLSKTTGKQLGIDRLVRINYLFMAAVVALLLPIIFNGGWTLGGFYYRALAAVGIVDATLTLVVVILHSLYLQKHPQVKDPVYAVRQIAGETILLQQGQAPPHKSVARRVVNVFLIVLVVLISFQLLVGVVVGLIGAAFWHD